jgi:hypothetical protein
MISRLRHSSMRSSSRFSSPSNDASLLGSVISFHLPFGGPGVLLVTPERSTSLEALWRPLLAQRGPLIWLCRADLWQLCAPNPYEPHTFPLPYWIREEGVIEIGEDLRHEIPYLRDSKRLLKSHIELSLFWTRNKLILTSLIEGLYLQLAIRLKRERQLLMQSALLIHSIWKVSPTTIEGIFADTFRSQSFVEVMTALQAAHLKSISHHRDEAAALELVWLHERFMNELWDISKC